MFGADLNRCGFASHSRGRNEDDIEVGKEGVVATVDPNLSPQGGRYDGESCPGVIDER